MSICFAGTGIFKILEDTLNEFDLIFTDLLSCTGYEIDHHHITTTVLEVCYEFNFGVEKDNRKIAEVVCVTGMKSTIIFFHLKVYSPISILWVSQS